MGILNFFGIHGDDGQTVLCSRTKGPCATLLEHGIDPTELKFSLDEDGWITVTGRVRDESQRHRICQLIGAMPLVRGVRNRAVISETPGAEVMHPRRPSESVEPRRVSG